MEGTSTHIICFGISELGHSTNDGLGIGYVVKHLSFMNVCEAVRGTARSLGYHCRRLESCRSCLAQLGIVDVRNGMSIRGGLLPATFVIQP